MTTAGADASKNADGAFVSWLLMSRYEPDLSALLHDRVTGWVTQPGWLECS